MTREKHWALPGRGALTSDLELWGHAYCWVSSLAGMCLGTLASSTLQTLQEAEGWSIKTNGVSSNYLPGKLGAGSKDMGEEFNSPKTYKWLRDKWKNVILTSNQRNAI